MAVSIKNQQKRLPVTKEKVKKIVEKILSEFAISRYKICIAFLDDKRIRQLNKKFTKHDCPTDVLAFPYLVPSAKEEKVLWADIAISTDAAVRNSSYYNNSPEKELHLYVIHGILHLLGFKDKTKIQRQKMEKEQNHWLDKLRID